MGLVSVTVRRDFIDHKYWEKKKSQPGELECCDFTEQEWAASWSPRSHCITPPLGQSLVTGAASRSATARGVVCFENFQVRSLLGSSASVGN